MRIRIFLKLPSKEFKISRSFKTRSVISKRTVEVGEAFGIGIDEEKIFTVYQDFPVQIEPADVVYITGDSGGGKSLFLQEIAGLLSENREFGGVVREDQIRVDPDEVLVEGVGGDAGEAVSILSNVGLNEAYLMLRRYRELSDGQRYRYRLAKMLCREERVWIFDEFCATLDRTTARVVAYCIQKTARRMKRTVIMATTHEDLMEDVNPDLVVEKRFGSAARITYLTPQPRESSILGRVVIEPGGRKEFLPLEEFHYRATLPTMAKRIFLARLDGEVVGGIAYVPPHIHLAARRKAVPGYFRPSEGMKEYLKRLNREFVRIARVIVVPKLRSIGLGVRLVKETMPLMNTPYVETLAVMARYNPFFERAGMVRVERPLTPYSERRKRALIELEAMGFNLELLPSSTHVSTVMDSLNPDNFDRLCKIVSEVFLAKKFCRPGLIDRVRGGDRQAIIEAMKKGVSEPVYLIWRNQDLPAGG